MALQHIKEIDTQIFLGIKTRNLFKLGSKSVNSIDPISHFSDILVELKYPSSSYESNYTFFRSINCHSKINLK